MRITTRTRRLVGLVLGSIAALATVALATAAANGPMSFTPIAGSSYGQTSNAWNEPFIIPDGFTQQRVSDESTFDIYPGIDDLTDMNTTNETGREAGRYL